MSAKCMARWEMSTPRSAQYADAATQMSFRACLERCQAGGPLAVRRPIESGEPQMVPIPLSARNLRVPESTRVVSWRL